MEKIINNVEEFLNSETPYNYALTHSGPFHCDDVFSAVILDELMHGKLTLIRTPHVPTNCQLNNLIIFDIGGGEFDHHMTNPPKRKNGKTFSSVGLIWKKYGRKLLKKKGVSINNVNYIANKIDKELIQAIDASDNGELQSSFPQFTISKVITNFNPIWDFEEEFNNCFEKAFQIAKIIFDNLLEKEMAQARAKDSIEKAITKSENGIMVLPQFIPWQEYLINSKNPQRKEIQYVIYKSDRDNYFCVHVTPFANNRLFPLEWAGLKSENLIESTKVKTATFCHPKRYLCGAQTLEDAIELANIAMAK